jgi:hypothetical protein
MQIELPSGTFSIACCAWNPIAWSSLSETAISRSNVLISRSATARNLRARSAGCFMQKFSFCVGPIKSRPN